MWSLSDKQNTGRVTGLESSCIKQKVDVRKMLVDVKLNLQIYPWPWQLLSLVGWQLQLILGVGRPPAHAVLGEGPAGDALASLATVDVLEAETVLPHCAACGREGRKVVGSFLYIL